MEIGQQPVQAGILGRDGVAGPQSGEGGEFVVGGRPGSLGEQSGYRADQRPQYTGLTRVHLGSQLEAAQ